MSQECAGQLLERLTVLRYFIFKFWSQENWSWFKYKNWVHFFEIAADANHWSYLLIYGWIDARGQCLVDTFALDICWCTICTDVTCVNLILIWSDWLIWAWNLLQQFVCIHCVRIFQGKIDFNMKSIKFYNRFPLI